MGIFISSYSYIATLSQWCVDRGCYVFFIFINLNNGDLFGPRHFRPIQ